MTGIDAWPVDSAVNAVVPYARAKVSGRIHPEQDPLEAQAALARHFESLRPYGVSLVVHTAETGSGFAADTGGTAYAAAREALAEAWGGEPVSIATGGSIIHELGTVRMGGNASTSVLNQWCQAWDCRNLFVADGGPFVSQADKNPTWTIMALAMRTADRILEQRKAGAI